MMGQLPGGLQICFHDEDFTTKWISDGLCQMLGFKSQGIICRRQAAAELFIVEEDYDRMYRQVQQSLEREIPTAWNTVSGVVMAESDGYWMPESCIKTAAGEPVICCLVTDITRRVRRENQLRETRKIKTAGFVSSASLRYTSMRYHPVFNGKAVPHYQCQSGSIDCMDIRKTSTGWKRDPFRTVLPEDL